MVAINHIVNKKGKKSLGVKDICPQVLQLAESTLLSNFLGGYVSPKLERAVLPNVSPGDICSKWLVEVEL